MKVSKAGSLSVNAVRSTHRLRRTGIAGWHQVMLCQTARPSFANRHPAPHLTLDPGR